MPASLFLPHACNPDATSAGRAPGNRAARFWGVHSAGLFSKLFNRAASTAGPNWKSRYVNAFCVLGSGQCKPGQVWECVSHLPLQFFLLLLLFLSFFHFSFFSSSSALSHFLLLLLPPLPLFLHFLFNLLILLLLSLLLPFRHYKALYPLKATESFGI